MSMKVLLQSAAITASLLIGVTGTASAQIEGCEVTELSAASAATDLYLQAETKLLVEDDIAGANELITQMRALELNCLEEGIALGMSAQIKIRLEDYAGAVVDIRTSLERGYIPADRRTETLLTIAQLYFQNEEIATGLDYMNQWVAAGGAPTRDQKQTLATVNYQLDKFPEAVRWMEEVFEEDGPDAERSVYDFLILLYDRTGNQAKRAQLLEQLLTREPGDRQIWQQISYDYSQADDTRKAFEVQKAMYLGGILSEEDEIMRIVQYYNLFNAPYEAARVLEKEINAGRIERSFDRLSLLADLYQQAREHERVVEVIEAAAREYDSAIMYERLGRAFAELKQWEKAEEKLLQAFEASGQMEDRSSAWFYIGQSRFERDDREGAREAFRTANNAAGRDFLTYMASQDRNARDRQKWALEEDVLTFENEKEVCKKLAVVGQALPEGCATVDDRITEAKAALRNF